MQELQRRLRAMRDKERTLMRQVQRERRGKIESRGGSFPGPTDEAKAGVFPAPLSV
jgi:hypothetical protein